MKTSVTNTYVLLLSITQQNNPNNDIVKTILSSNGHHKTYSSRNHQSNTAILVPFCLPNHSVYYKNKELLIILVGKLIAVSYIKLNQNSQYKYQNSRVIIKQPTELSNQQFWKKSNQNIQTIPHISRVSLCQTTQFQLEIGCVSA